MHRRFSLFALILAAALTMLAALGTRSADADSITRLSSFSDPRGDLPARSGTIYRARYGPYTIPAEGQLNNRVFSVPAPCANCRITDMVPNLVYADGSTANFDSGPMLHHFVLSNPGATDLTCGSRGVGGLGERFMASGNERTHVHLPSGYGYPNSQPQWRLIVDLMNHEAQPKTVYVQVVFRTRSSAATPKPVKPAWLDIDNCGDSRYSIPTGYSDRHADWTVNRTGYMVGMAGHTHDLDHEDPSCMMMHCADQGGGAAVSAEVRGGQSSTYFGPVPRSTNHAPAGATLCRSQAYYGTPRMSNYGYEGHLDTMSLCGLFSDVPSTAQPQAYPSRGAYPSQGYPVQRGRTIRLHSEYRNNTGAPLNDVMGIMIGYLYVTG